MVINRKVPKSNAGYGSNPFGFSCGVCMYFKNNTCALVEGSIKPKDCCNLFNSATYRAAK
jgi:hypothetical protein